MKTFIIRELLKPTLTRVGAMLGGYLIGSLAVEPDVANQIIVGFVAAGSLVLDFITRKVVK